MYIIPACHSLGMLIPLPHTQCQYLECVYTDAPWHNAVALASIVRDCPDGAGLPEDYKAGFISPCTEFYTKCYESKRDEGKSCLNFT